MKALQIKVYGRVQGVFYRASTKAVADQLGVKGIVKNETDGSVFIEAEADEFSMEAFLEWCKYGPDDAYVQKLDIIDIEIKNYRNFEVLKK